MARYRRSMALRPIHRIKHVVDRSGTVVAGTQLNEVPLIDTVDAPTLASTNEVETGAKVNGIYLKVEVASNETDAGAIPNVYMMITKNPGNNITIPIASNVGSNDNKRFVIHQEMVMLNNLAGGNPRIMFNGVIVIPKGYRRFGPDDALTFSILSPQVNIAFCLQCHYKEFR